MDHWLSGYGKNSFIGLANYTYSHATSIKIEPTEGATFCANFMKAVRFVSDE